MQHDPDCIFCKIVAGDIPCHKLYEDEFVLAFLDIGPLSLGHSLVIPREHFQTLEKMPEDVAAACGRLLPRLGRAVTIATGNQQYNVLQNNGKLAHQVVPHVHFHIIPKTDSAGLGIIWPAGKLDPADAEQLKQNILAVL